MGPNRARVESELGRISIWASFGLSDRSKAKGPPSLLGRRFAPTRSPLEAGAASSPRWTSPFSSSNTPPSPSPPSLSPLSPSPAMPDFPQPFSPTTSPSTPIEDLVDEWLVSGFRPVSTHPTYLSENYTHELNWIGRRLSHLR